MFGKRLSRALAVTTVGTLIMAGIALADNLNDTLVAGGSGASPTIGEGGSFSQSVDYQIAKTGNNNTSFPAAVNFSKGSAPSWVSISATSNSFDAYTEVFTLVVSGTAPSGSAGLHSLTVSASPPAAHP